MLLVFENVLHLPFSAAHVLSLDSVLSHSVFSLLLISEGMNILLRDVPGYSQSKLGLSSWTLLTCPSSYNPTVHRNSVSLLRTLGWLLRPGI